MLLSVLKGLRFWVELTKGRMTCINFDNVNDSLTLRIAACSSLPSGSKSPCSPAGDLIIGLKHFILFQHTKETPRMFHCTKATRLHKNLTRHQQRRRKKVLSMLMSTSEICSTECLLTISFNASTYREENNRKEVGGSVNSKYMIFK